MHTFTDTDRRLWKVRLSIPVMDRVRDETGVDIGVWDNLQVVNMSAIDLANVLWVMVASQAKKMRVTRDTFRAAVSGDALHDAQKAFIDEYLLFVPSDRQRTLTRAIAFQKRVAEIERVESDRLETLSDDQILQLSAATQETSGNDATELPASVESTRTSTVSAS